jgi:hypothetical protein
MLLEVCLHTLTYTKRIALIAQGDVRDASLFTVPKVKRTASGLFLAIVS